MNSQVKTLVVVNIALAVAVAILFVIQFSGNDEKSEANNDDKEAAEKDLTADVTIDDDATEDEVKTDSAEETKIIDSNLVLNQGVNQIEGKIGFIYVEKLLMEYKFYNDLEAQLEWSTSAKQQELLNQQKAFETEYYTFMEKAQKGTFLSQERQMQEQARIEKMGQDLTILEENMANQLVEQQQNMQLQLLDTVTNFLKEYNKNLGYSYIINASSCLLVDEAHDVTDTVTALLNARYKK
jgi:outer membrane protein